MVNRALWAIFTQAEFLTSCLKRIDHFSHKILVHIEDDNNVKILRGRIERGLGV